MIVELQLSYFKLIERWSTNGVQVWNDVSFLFLVFINVKGHWIMDADWWNSYWTFFWWNFFYRFWLSCKFASNGCKLFLLFINLLILHQHNSTNFINHITQVNNFFLYNSKRINLFILSFILSVIINLSIRFEYIQEFIENTIFFVHFFSEEDKIVLTYFSLQLFREQGLKAVAFRLVMFVLGSGDVVE